MDCRAKGRATYSLDIERDETSQRVGIGVRLSVESTAGDVSWAETSERVDGSSVSSDFASRRESGTLSNQRVSVPKE